MRKLENRVTLVTSTTKGIGLACILKLAGTGASVYMGARRLQAIQKICDEYREKGYKVVPVYLDATDRSSYQSMVERTIQETGQINILVNNLGVGKPVENLGLVSGSRSAFFDILDLNLGSAYRISKLMAPHMLKTDGGFIVNISSIRGTIPDVTRIGYGASKSMINNITQQIAVQFARRNICCNAVLPGLTATDTALKNVPEEFLKPLLSHIPLNRMGAPEDIANAVPFPSCDDSTYIAGHILDVAGGYRVGTPQYGGMMRK